MVRAADEVIKTLEKAFNDASYGIDDPEDFEKVFLTTRAAILDLLDYVFVSGHAAIKAERENNTDIYRPLSAEDIAEAVKLILRGQLSGGGDKP